MSDKIQTKKGFTLIELLAVIIVIGVVALITVPLINQVIVRSRMSALESSAESILRETNLQTAMDKIGEDTEILITDERLNLKNNQFTSGFIFKNADGKLELKNVTNGVFCINGTSGNLTVTRGDCSTKDTSAPSLTLQSGYIGATEAMVLAQGSDQESGIKGYEYKIEDGSYTDMQDDNFYLFEGLERNTSYKITVRVTNGAGLTTEKSITIKTKSVSAATFVVSDADKWTNKKDVTIQYPTRVSGVVYRYRVGDGNWETLTSGNKKELQVNTNTMIYAEVILNEETVSSSVNITKIDNTPPTITSITPSTTSWTRQVTIQIIATDTPSGIAGYSYNDGATWTDAPTYTTTKNGTYKIKVRDYANNITSGTITISNIDRTGPKCVSSGGNNTWTNTSRTITGTCIDDGEGAGCVQKTITKVIDTDTNAKVSPGSVFDEAGNEAVCPATEMVRVDTTPPTCDVSGISDGWTNKKVTAYGKCKDSLSGCITDDLRKEFTTEMNEKVTLGTVRDRAGNEADCVSDVAVKIDMTAPTCVSSGGNTAWTSGSRTIVGTCSDTGGSGCKENIFYTYSGTSGQHYSITNAGPAGEGKAGTVYDNAGNSASCQANQTVRIDKKAPTCSVSQKANSGGSSVTITGTCSDTGGSGCKGNVSRNVTSNGTYSPGTVYDNVNNSVTCSSITVTKVDTIAPSCPTITADHTAQKWTKDTVTLTITPTSDTVSWDWYTNTNGGAWSDWGTNTGQKSKTLSGSGKRQGKIVVRDAAGNERTCTTSVYWVDKVKPYTPVISKITYSTGKGYTVSGVTSRKTQNNVSISFSAKNGYCSGKTKETWKVYGDTANANANSGYTIQAQMSCNGEDCYALINGKKYNGGTGGKWITVSNISSINGYAGVAGYHDGKVITSKATWKIRLKDGAGNYSGTLTYKNTWCT